MNTIYSTTDFEIDHDTDDDDQPILVTTDDNGYKWLDSTEARDTAYAILKALNVDRPQFASASDDLNRDLIAVAIAHERPIRFRYAKGADGAVIELRTLKPEQITEAGKDKHEVVQGWDSDRDDFRMYRLDRIKGKVSIG